MRCLYCGKELALLKRWTRSGQFCSEAHKKSYQEEYNRIGLNRLLQAQHKSAPAKVAEDRSAAPNGPPPTHQTEIAVEEAPAFEDVSVVEEAPAFEDASVGEEGAQHTAGLPVEQNTPEEDAWEPRQIAGFINEHAIKPTTSEIPLYSEAWEAIGTLPAAPPWRTEIRVQQVLSPAPVVALKFRPGLSESGLPAAEVKMTPNEFVPSRAATPPVGFVAATKRLPSAGPIPQQVRPCPSELTAAAACEDVLQFLIAHPPEMSLLDLPCSTIAFQPVDADVEFVAGGTAAAGIEAEQEQDASPADRAAASDEGLVDESPSGPEAERQTISEHAGQEVSRPAEVAPAELQGLANLHEGLTQAAEATSIEDSPAPEKNSTETEATEPVVEDEAAPAVADQQRQPRNAELVDMPLKPLAPAKPSAKEGAAAQIELPVFLPRVTGLPLRPKMGLVQGAPPASKKAGGRPTGQPVQPAADAKAPADSKPAGESKPAPNGGATAEQAAKVWGKPAPAASNRTSPQNVSTVKSQKQSAKEASASKETGAVTEPPAPKQTPLSKQPAKPIKNVDRPAPVTPAQEAKQPVKGAEATAAEQKTAGAQTKAAQSPERAASSIQAPTFGAGQPAGTSLLSSSKAKIAAAAVVLALGAGAYFMFGGKSQAPASSAATASSDAAGPSIMVGGGGWVEGWGGDPTGAHYGRQITIYRPSLKLSDYRIEFRGEIETKSLGWVFRAADPDNYYAMKLAIVKPGAQPKIALLKYLVTHGRETQVGRVPIDINVNLDTLYNVRVDVRGPKFTTYVQGQQVDTWIDDQLKLGGMGFLNEREERGRIKTVTVSLLNGGKQ